MSGWQLWISEHVAVVLIAGLLISVGLTTLAVRSAWRSWRKIRSGESRVWIAIVPVVLFVPAGLGLLYFGSGSAVMGPELVGQHRLVGAEAPELRFARVVDGTEARLDDHRGRVVVLNLWATWCPPCRHELPALDRLQDTYRERGLVVVHISDEPQEVLAEFLEAEPMGTEHGFVPEMPWPAAGRPTTYVIDREGVVRRVILGPRSFEQFEAEIRRLL